MTGYVGPGAHPTNSPEGKGSLELKLFLGLVDDSRLELVGLSNFLSFG